MTPGIKIWNHQLCSRASARHCRHCRHCLYVPPLAPQIQIGPSVNPWILSIIFQCSVHPAFFIAADFALSTWPVLSGVSSNSSKRQLPAVFGWSTYVLPVHLDLALRASTMEILVSDFNIFQPIPRDAGFIIPKKHQTKTRLLSGALVVSSHGFSMLFLAKWAGTRAQAASSFMAAPALRGTQ